MLGATLDAKSLLAATLKTQRQMLGDEHSDTLTTMERLADLYRRHGENEPAQTLLAEALGGRRRLFGREHLDTVVDLTKLALVHLQQQRYAEVQSLLRDIASGSAPGAWQRDFSLCVLGAALSGKKKYEEAERLLTEGYQRMTEHAATIPADGRTALQLAGQWIIQLYQASGRPQLASEWNARLAASGKTQK